MPDPYPTRDAAVSRLPDRRAFLAGAGLAALPSAAPAAGRKPALRIAHLTDVHVQPERKAAEGMTACLNHAQSQKAKPDLILFGGDCIMDAFAQTRSRTKLQWDLWHRVLKAECSLPWLACIGNHDVWGWDRERSKATGDEKDYGKRWAADALAMPRRYHAFEKAGWKFLVLDSTHRGPKPGSYTAKLDPEQFDWLAAELKATPKTTPVLVLSHIPVFAACPFLDGDNEKTGDWNVPGAWMHIDARRLTEVFHDHGNVKACLSGHIHLADRVDYLGTSYFCNGAVCGGWWKGKYQQFAEGYALVDLYADGAVACEYVVYGWKAEPADEKKS